MNNISAALSRATEPKIAFAEWSTCHCLSCASEVQGKNVFNHILRKLGHPLPPCLPGHSDAVISVLLEHEGPWVLQQQPPLLPSEEAREGLLFQNSPMWTKNMHILNFKCVSWRQGWAWYLDEVPAIHWSGETPPKSWVPVPPLLRFPFSLFLWRCSSLGWSVQIPSEKGKQGMNHHSWVASKQKENGLGEYTLLLLAFPALPSHVRPFHKRSLRTSTAEVIWLN